MLDQGATTACSGKLQFNLSIKYEISGFYFHFIACLGVTLPRMLLVHLGFPGEFAVPWLQPVCPGLALGKQAMETQGGELVCCSVLDFVFLQPRGIGLLPPPAPALCFPRKLTVGSSRLLCSLRPLLCDPA